MQGVNIAGVMAFLLFSCRLPWYKYCARLEIERRREKERKRERKREKEKESEEEEKCENIYLKHLEMHLSPYAGD